MADPKKCAHQVCTCSVSGKDKYCSQQCEANAKTHRMTIGCDCPHHDCTGKL